MHTSKALSAWTASFVRRWHTHPQLCDTVDYTSGHQQRVARLMLSFDRDISRDAIIAALLHDQGERETGDVSNPVKTRNPDLRDVLHVMELDGIAAQGYSFPSLTGEEADLLKLCDWTDSYLWMLRHQPKYADDPAWISQLDRMSHLAFLLGHQTRFIELCESAERMFT